MIELPQSVQFLKGAGPRRAERLGVLGIGTVGDLLVHYPRDYVDRSRLTKIGAFREGARVTAIVEVERVSTRPTRRGRQDFRAVLHDETGRINAVWFNQSYLRNYVKPGARLMMSADVRRFRGLELHNPEYELLADEDQELLNTGRIVPVYPLTSGVTQRLMRSWVRQALDAPGVGEPDPLPDEVRERGEWMTYREAILTVHFPDSWEQLRRARRRLVFDELFYYELLLIGQRRVNEREPGIAFPAEGTLSREVARSLPFSLTDAQRRTILEIRDDMRLSRPMNRLILGDVGSGKTVVALLAGCLAVESGYQVALLAPTEILAEQHAKTLGTFLGGRVPVRLLTGRTKAKARRLVHSAAESAEAGFFVGTHALLEDPVRFAQLGLVIVDEQHRFGVRQRATLMAKGLTPDVLVMTATPIPRTLAMTRYADLDLSILDEKPANRGAITTHLVGERRREEVYEFVRRQLDRGLRCYVIYPLVTESEKLDLAAATEAATRLRNHPLFRGIDVGLLHGKMKGEEKQRVMEAFRTGESPLLVSTTVVEVGVDVPEATVMIVEHPERYGLSQLHQLRGRIGRSELASTFFLVTPAAVSRQVMDRLAVLVRTSSGFDVAEKDLEARGPGEFFGTRQHGAPGLRLANFIEDSDVLSEARAAADLFLTEHPDLRGPHREQLLAGLKERFGERADFYRVA